MGRVTSAVKASAKLMGTSEVGKGPQSYPELEQGGWTFISPHQSITGCKVPWERRLFSAKAIPEDG